MENPLSLLLVYHSFVSTTTFGDPQLVSVSCYTATYEVSLILLIHPCPSTVFHIHMVSTKLPPWISEDTTTLSHSANQHFRPAPNSFRSCHFLGFCCLLFGLFGFFYPTYSRSVRFGNTPYVFVGKRACKCFISVRGNRYMWQLYSFVY